VPAVYLNREERPARTMAGSLGFTERFSARNKVNAAVEVSGAEHCRGPAARRSVAMDRFKARDEAAAGIGQAEGGDEWFFGLPSDEEVLPDPVERGREHSSHDVDPRLLDVGPEPTHQRSTAVKFSDRFGDTREGCVLAIDRPLDALPVPLRLSQRLQRRDRGLALVGVRRQRANARCHGVGQRLDRRVERGRIQAVDL